MAKARSPQYPAIGLKEAVDKIGAVYEKDYQNPISREVAGTHMGYKSLHGGALGVLSALGKYGLLEGRGDETKVSDLAVAIIAHPTGAPERAEAIREAAAKPKLFAELDGRFPNGKASDQAIRSYLMTQKYIPAAADSAIRAYRETKLLVDAELVGYQGGEEEEDEPETPPMTPHLQAPPKPGSTPPLPPVTAKPGMLQEVFNLDEGPVTLAFPSELSEESYEELKAQLELFLRRAQRRARQRLGEKVIHEVLAAKKDEAAN
jgi:hypothetical protein